MNLRWNPSYRRFEVEFHNLWEEQPLVKAAGFKTDGPPTWLWWSAKSAPLTELREGKPPQLTINPDAKVEYIALKALEDKQAELKKIAQKNAKELKKKLQHDKQDKLKPGEYFDEGVGFICLKVDTSRPLAVAQKYIPPPPPDEKCIICGEGVYPYEYATVIACLWCQKIVLDNDGEVC
jgi:hypothetical protein